VFRLGSRCRSNSRPREHVGWQAPAGFHHWMLVAARQRRKRTGGRVGGGEPAEVRIGGGGRGLVGDWEGRGIGEEEESRKEHLTYKRVP
jgi:hypothetical protein